MTQAKKDAGDIPRTSYSKGVGSALQNRGNELEQYFGHEPDLC